MAVFPKIGVDPVDAAELAEGLVRVDLAQMRRAGAERLSTHRAIAEGLYRYDRRDPGERWKTYDDATRELRARGVARMDCEDLAALLVAELRLTGEDPAAFVHVYRARCGPSGGCTYHVIVGSPRLRRWLDPSVAAGMGRE